VLSERLSEVLNVLTMFFFYPHHLTKECILAIAPFRLLPIP
jgi:hypothetical protein